MKKIFSKLKTKWINTDINKKRKILTISILAVFVISSSIVLTKISATTYTLVKEKISDLEPIDKPSFSGKLNSGFAELESLDELYDLGKNSTVENDDDDVFCIEPYAAISTEKDAYSEIDPLEIGSALNCGSNNLGCNTYTEDLRKYFSLITYYYSVNKNTYTRAAAQTLIWELTAGGRTNFNEYRPDGYNGEDSFWGKYVNIDSDKYNESFASAYNKIIDYVYYYEKDPSFVKSTYEMSYDSSTNKYTTTINYDKENKEDYIMSWYKDDEEDPRYHGTCSAGDEDVEVVVGDDKVTVTSSVNIEGNVTITCMHNDANKDSNFHKLYGTGTSGYQRLAWGYGTPSHSFEFYVKTEGFPVSINKNDEDGNKLSGTKFTISNETDTYEIDGNGDPVTIKQPGNYTIEETTVPDGYQKMQTQQVYIDENNTSFTFVDKALKIKFYKEDFETKKRINGAGFKIYDGNTLVRFDEKDSNGCYKVNSNGSVEEVFTNTNLNNGEICLSHVISSKEYIIEETTVPAGYTKMQNATVTATAYDNTATNISEKGLINYPTKFEFIKSINDDSSNIDSSITSLVDIAKFTITENNSTKPLTFIDKGNGEYWYDINGNISLLHTTNRKFIVKYLPRGNYQINEAEYVLSDSEKQIIFGNTNIYNGTLKGVFGYYYNDSEPFTITEYNNGIIENMDSSKATIVNKLAKINFEKKDIYNYYTSDDISKLNSNEKLLDTAKFIVKDKSGNILSFKKVSDGIYRYLPIDQNNTVSEINTYNGKLTITHLVNNTNYILEEVESPEGFILSENHPKVTYNLSEKDLQNEKDSSITQVIENIPTKVKIEKRNLKTGYLIKDIEEKTTFELYKIENDGSRKRIYVTGREPIIDSVGNVEYSYRYSKTNKKTDISIKLTNGYIVFRYLPKGSYVLVETEAPEGYDLPIGSLSETKFEVSGTTTDSDTEVVKNKPSKIILKKYSEDGLLLSGAKFKVYKVSKDEYDSNLSAKNNALLNGKIVKLKTIRAGEYEYKDEKDTEIITTCSKDCELIGKETNSEGTIEKGMLQIEYLDTENYYIFEEIEAPNGYTLPDDPYTLVYLKESVDNEEISIEIENKYTPVTFYKFDEYNNLLDGAVYKLQKLNSNKIYEDITVSKVEEKEGSVYLIDFNTDNVDIITSNGQATIYLLTEGQYRILETKAPEGYELPKASINVASFFVTDDGNVKGDFIITNKKPTITNIKLNKASSELVISIQTGQTIIKYSLIIIGLVSIIILLIFINKKLK